MMKFMKYEKRSHFFKYVRFQYNASISSSLRDVALKPFFSNSSTKTASKCVNFRVIKARVARPKNQFGKCH